VCGGIAVEQSTIDEIKGLIGIETGPVIIEVEKGMIKRLAEAVEDPNPLWQDEEYARKSKYGRIIAPPGFLHTAMMVGKKPEIPQLASMTRLDGGGDWQYFAPIKVGDRLTFTSKLTNVRVREGETGKTFFLTTEMTWRNQEGEMVAVNHSTTILH